MHLHIYFRTSSVSLFFIFYHRHVNVWLNSHSRSNGFVLWNLHSKSANFSWLRHITSDNDDDITGRLRHYAARIVSGGWLVHRLQRLTSPSWSDWSTVLRTTCWRPSSPARSRNSSSTPAFSFPLTTSPRSRLICFTATSHALVLVFLLFWGDRGSRGFSFKNFLTVSCWANLVLCRVCVDLGCDNPQPAALRPVFIMGQCATHVCEVSVGCYMATLIVTMHICACESLCAIYTCIYSVQLGCKFL